MKVKMNMIVRTSTLRQRCMPSSHFFDDLISQDDAVEFFLTIGELMGARILVLNPVAHLH